MIDEFDVIIEDVESDIPDTEKKINLEYLEKLKVEIRRLKALKGYGNFYIRRILERLAHNRNYIVIICGETGLSKSYSAIKLAQRLDIHGWPFERLVFNGRDMIKLARAGKIPKYSVVIWDEAGASGTSQSGGGAARDFMSKLNKVFSTYSQTARKRNFVLIFTLPDTFMLDKHQRILAHAMIEMEKINYSENRAIGRIYLIKYKNRYKLQQYIYPKIYENDGSFSKMPFLAFHKIDAKTAHTYEKIKDKWFEQLEADMDKEFDNVERKVEETNKKRKTLNDEEMINLALEANRKGLIRANQMEAEFKLPYTEARKVRLKMKELQKNGLITLQDTSSIATD